MNNSTDNFKWTDELVREFANFYKSKQGVDYTTWGKCIMDSFKKSKSPSTNLSDGKDWEIVSFKVKNVGYGFDGQILPKVDGYFGIKELHVTEEELLKSKIHYINSVRRLSDNAVFTHLERDGDGNLITGFSVVDNKMRVELDYGSVYKNIIYLTEPTNVKLPTNPIPDTPVKEKIQVDLADGFNNAADFTWVAHLYATTGIPKNKFPAIKQAIEKVLNEEDEYAPAKPAALNEDTVVKPPLGVVPEFIWKEQRFNDLDAAIKRYSEAKKPVPISWISEHCSIQQWIKNREEEKTDTVVQDKPETVSTNNDDVACLSLNDVSRWYEAWYPRNPMKESLLNGLNQLVNQKLKQ